MNSFRQTYTTRLYDHVQEWRRRRSMCRAFEFEDHLYMDWFLRTLLSPIGKYVTSHFPQTEEEDLQKTLKYDLIYSQLGYVYIFLPGLPQLGAINVSGASHATNSIIRYLSHPQAAPYP